jgi:hypothetical protein
MSSGQMTVLAAAVAAAVLALVVLLAVLVSARRGRRRTEAALAASRAEIAALEGRLDALVAQHASPAAPPAPRHRAGEPEFVITTAGDVRERDASPAPAPPQVDARQFASVAVGESLVRLVSLGYGVRRALSAENRNRIAFEMRRERLRSRKDRRRELRDLRRRLREEPGADAGAARTEDAA